MLLSPDGSRAIGMSGVGLDLLPLLRHGASMDDLRARLHGAGAKASGTDPKLDAFLAVLRGAGMLESAPAERKPVAGKYLPLPNPDALAHWLVRGWRAVPRALTCAGLPLLVAAAIAGLIAIRLTGFQFHPQASDWPFGASALAIFICIVVPLHELAHAIACRAAGAPVSACGLRLLGGFFPVPWVDTTQAYRVPSRWLRFRIPAAGPLVDLLGAGGAAWTACCSAGAVNHTATYLMVLCLGFLYFDTNPLSASDGSHMAEAMLDDELARHAALSIRATRRRASAWPYRMLCAAHLAAAIALLYWLSLAPHAAGAVQARFGGS